MAMSVPTGMWAAWLAPWPSNTILDPEDDLLPDGTSGVHLTYQTRAILLDCDNYGTVEARKSCAGGVTGRMDLGTIYGQRRLGTVSSESGDYVGGVCGLSISTIRKS